MKFRPPPTARAAGKSAASSVRSHSPTRLVVFGGGLLIAAIALGAGVILANLRDRALIGSQRELQNTALILAEQIDQIFEAVEHVQTNMLERMQVQGIASSQDYERQMSGYDVHLMLKDKVVGLPQVGTFTLISAEGKLFNFSRFWPIPNIDVADRDFFKALRSDPSQTSFMSKPIRNRATGTWVVQIARKVSGPNGEFFGLVLGALEMPRIERFFQSIVLGTGSSISLVHRDGELLARHPHVDSMVGRPLSDTPDGVEDRLVAIHRVPHYPLAVAAAASVTAVLADWRHTAAYLTCMAALAILIIAGFVALIIRQFKNYESLERARAEKTEAKKLREQKLQLDAAVENMTQGLCMFDTAARLVLCNDRYIEMYRLPPEAVKPGCTMRELVDLRKEAGPSRASRNSTAPIFSATFARANRHPGSPRPAMVVPSTGSTVRSREAAGSPPMRT